VNTSAILHFYFAMRWLSIRLDILTTLVAFTVALVVTLAKQHIAQSYAAIALVYAAKARTPHPVSKKPATLFSTMTFAFFGRFLQLAYLIHILVFFSHYPAQVRSKLSSLPLSPSITPLFSVE